MRKQNGQAIAFSPVRVGESGKSKTIQVPSASRSRLAYDYRQQSDHVVDKYQSPGSSEISNISILDAFEMGGAFRYVDQHDTGDLSVYQYNPSTTTGYDLIGLISHNRLPIFRTSIRVSNTILETTLIQAVGDRSPCHTIEGDHSVANYPPLEYSSARRNSRFESAGSH